MGGVDEHIWEWGVMRKREGLGGAGKDCPHVHENTPSLPDWMVSREEIIIQEFKKHLPHHLCAENKATEKNLFLPRQCG